MSPELLSAVQERIQIGHTKNEIHTELEAAGYSSQMIEEVYLAAAQMSDIPPSDQSVPTQLLSCSALLRDSWSLLKDQWKLFAKAYALMALVFIIFGAALVAGSVAVLAYEEQIMNSLSTQILLLTGVALLVIIFLVSLRVVGFSVIKTLLDEDKTFSQNLGWSLQNLIPVVLVGLFAYFAVQTGNLLLIIPGIAAAVYLYFSSYVFAIEGVKGVDALVRSAEIVYQRWWGVFGRFLCVFLIFFGIFFVAIVVGTVLLIPELDVSQWGPLSGLVFTFWLVLLTVATAFFQTVTVTLFKSLQATASPNKFSDERRKKVRFWLLVMVVIGPFAAALLQIPNLLSTVEGVQNPDASLESNASMQLLLESTMQDGEAYYVTDGSFSYLGVCAALDIATIFGDSAQCNESMDAWALSVSDGETWCADSSGFNKRMSATLEQRTQCVSLPSAEELEAQLQPPTNS